MGTITLTGGSVINPETIEDNPEAMADYVRTLHDFVTLPTKEQEILMRLESGVFREGLAKGIIGKEVEATLPSLRKSLRG